MKIQLQGEYFPSCYVFPRDYLYGYTLIYIVSKHLTSFEENKSVIIGSFVNTMLPHQNRHRTLRKSLYFINSLFNVNANATL